MGPADRAAAVEVLSLVPLAFGWMDVRDPAQRLDLDTPWIDLDTGVAVARCSDRGPSQACPVFVERILFSSLLVQNLGAPDDPDPDGGQALLLHQALLQAAVAMAARSPR